MNIKEGTPQNVHLKRIEPDQSVSGIDTIDDTIRNDAGRKWFVSQAIQPVLLVGGYNANSGRYMLGSWRDTMVPNSSWTTTSAAALTLTCPAGHRYRVYYAACRNATQATLCTLSAVIGGNAWTSLSAYSALAVQTTIVSIGNAACAIDAVAGTWGQPGVREIWLNAGDTLTLTLETYGAGNDTEHLFLFEDYEV